MKCPNCNAELPEGAQHCDHCGHKLETTSSGRPQRRLDVSDNSGAVQDSYKTTVSSTQNTTTVVDQRTDRRNSGLVLFGVVAVLAILAFVYFDGQTRRDATAATATAQAQIAAITATTQSAATLEARAEATATAEMAAATSMAVAAVATETFAPTATSQAVATSYARGVAAANIGDWPLAYTSFRAVFDADPNFEDVQEHIIAVALALTPTATPTATPTPVPTDTPVLPSPTATPTQTPTPIPPTATSTATPTPLSTPTLRPTSTLSTISTWTPTATLMTPTETPTQILAATAPVIISATGTGFANEQFTNPSQRERSALLAAELDGKRNLLAWVEGAQVEAVTVVNGGSVDTDVIRQVVSGRISRVAIVSQQYDDTTRMAIVELQLTLDRSDLP